MSIWLIDETLSDSTNPGQSECMSNGNEGFVNISQTPGLDPHHQMLFDIIPKTVHGTALINQFRFFFFFFAQS